MESCALNRASTGHDYHRLPAYFLRVSRPNSIHPGMIETDMTAEAIANARFKTERLDPTPLARLGLPEDVAYGALYLASDESSFVTGAELVIDGGWTAQ